MTITFRQSVDGDRVWIVVNGREVAYATTALLEKLEAAERAVDCGPRELWTDLIPYAPQPHTGF
jgi:hypothetical protein